LEAAIAECRAESAAHAILVTAPPGTGKSRLAWEAVRGVEGVEVMFARADAVTTKSPFAMAGQTIRVSAGILHDDPLASKIAKIRARVARHVRTMDQPRVTELLAELSDVRIPDAEASALLRSARTDPAIMEDALRS